MCHVTCPSLQTSGVALPTPPKPWVSIVLPRKRTTGRANYLLTSLPPRVPSRALAWVEIIAYAKLPLVPSGESGSGVGL